MDSLRLSETHDITPSQWSQPLRVIHLLLAIAVTAQLVLGDLMQDPRPGRPDSFGFMCHEVIGGCILAMIVVHWIWSLTHPNEGIRHLFPWTRTGLRCVFNELRAALFEQRLPAGGPEDRGLVGFVHGLGILAISGMVVLGGAFFVARAAGVNHGVLEVIKSVHDVGAVVVWVYWGGHLFAALMHSLLRKPVWQAMFDLRAVSSDTSAKPRAKLNA